MELEAFVIVETSFWRAFVPVNSSPEKNAPAEVAPSHSVAVYFYPLFEHAATTSCGPNPKSLQALKAMSEQVRFARRRSGSGS
jgi:hypothetical protein